MFPCTMTVTYYRHTLVILKKKYIYSTVNYILLCKHTLKHISRNVDVSWGEESDQFKAFSLGDKWNKAQEKKA